MPWLFSWWYWWSCSGRLVVVMVLLLVVEVFLTVRTLRMTIIRPVEQPDYLWPRCRGIFSRLSRFSASDILLGQWQYQCGSEINFHFDGQIKNLKRAACPLWFTMIWTTCVAHRRGFPYHPNADLWKNISPTSMRANELDKVIFLIYACFFSKFACFYT